MTQGVVINLVRDPVVLCDITKSRFTEVLALVYTMEQVMQNIISVNVCKMSGGHNLWTRSPLTNRSERCTAG